MATSKKIVMAAAGSGGEQFLKSRGLTGTQGFTMRTLSVTKDMQSATTGINIPNGYSPRSGAILTPARISYRHYWTDWGGDYFDNWGNFYLFNPADNTGSNITFSTSTINKADGTINTIDQNHFSQTFKVEHGWVAQGIFKLDVACTSSETFSFAMGTYGNMGSDSQTSNIDRTYTSPSWGTLHYNYNSQSGSREYFYTHVIPKKKADNDTFNIDSTGLFTAVSGNDNLAIWTGAFTHGFTWYFIKGSNSTTGAMYDWVANDIALSDTYHN